METTRTFIIDSEISFIAGPTTDSESIARSLSLSITSLSSQEYNCRLHCHAQFRIHRRRCQLRAHREGSCDLPLEWNLLLGLTAIDVPAIRGTSWILVDVFMRKYRVKFDVKGCTKHFSRCGGQRAVECGDDPPGGLSTLSAHQVAHGGVISHSSSSELSAHQMPARLTSGKGTWELWRLSSLFKNTPPIRGKDRERMSGGHMMWLPHHTRLGKGVERGHMMWLAHLTRFFTVFSTMLSWGLGLLGRTREPLGSVRLSISRVLVGLSMMHAPTPVMRVKK